ncbi:MAG: DUF6472 family protein [Eubacterium sp.]
MADLCENCWYNTYDEEAQEYYCDLQLDEDEYVRLLQEMSNNKPCRYYRRDIGEYGIVRKQN